MSDCPTPDACVTCWVCLHADPTHQISPTGCTSCLHDKCTPKQPTEHERDLACSAPIATKKEPNAAPLARKAPTPTPAQGAVVVPIRAARVEPTADTAAALYAFERAVFHLHDIAMRSRRDFDEAGEMAPGMLDAISEHLEACAVSFAGVRG